MKIAIIGSGISGLTAVHYLSKSVEQVDLYEAKSYLGGHTNTVEILDVIGPISVDTGFIVFNNRTYPNFIRLLTELGVSYQTSEMSFGIKHEPSGLEFRGANSDGLFAQRKRIFSLRHIRFLYEIFRFNKVAGRLRENLSHEMTVEEFFRQHSFRQDLLTWFFLPMGAAIWSTSCQSFMTFPIRFVLDFYFHHGLLSINDRPQWFTVCNGSRSYVQALVASSAANFYLDSPVSAIRRCPDGNVSIKIAGNQEVQYDHVIIATHSDQALKILENPTILEREILGSFRYERNLAILHTDTSILPRTKRAWASWNYLLEDGQEPKASVTYWMNKLQSIDAKQQYLVTLNAEHKINPEKIIRKIQYAHPQFDHRKFSASQRHDELINFDGISYCGAYWGAGFHEDGVRSSLRVINRLLGKATTTILENRHV